MSVTARQELIRKYWSLKQGKEYTFHQAMVDMYHQKHMSINQMSKELGVSCGIIHKWLRDEGISTRKMMWI